MKNFFRNLSTFSAGRTIVQAFSISLFAVIVVNAQTPASSTPSSAPSSTPAKGQPAAPASTGQTTTTGTQTTTQQSTEKGADPKKSADPKALLNQVEKADEKANDKNAATNEDADEAYRQAELTKMRRKIFGYQLFNNSKLSFEPSENLATPRDYTVGPGDELTAYIYGYSQSQIEMVVNSDGFAFVKPIGPVQLSGRTIEQAQKELITRLSPYYNNLGAPGSSASTYLQIRLGRIRTIRVMVLGEVITPGTYNVSSLSTALNALYLTGGPNELGSFRQINVVRRNKVVATLDLYELLMNGMLNTDIRLQDNDVVQVSVYKKRVEIKGNVKRPGLYELLPTEPIGKVLDYAGGFTDNAYTDRLKLLGLTSKERRIVDVRSSDYDKYIPSNGDEITADMLLPRFENMVTISGPVYRPGQYSLDQNKSLLQLIKNAEGLTGEAFTGRINVVRTRDDLSVENISINLADMMNGKTEDLLLRREDQIIIPSKFELREGAFIKVVGEVNQGPEVNLAYTSNLTLEDAIIRSGGFKESAATSKIEIVRRRRDVNVQSASAQIADIFIFDVNRDLTLNGSNSHFVLEPYDEILIRPSSNYQPQTFVTFQGEIVSPGIYGIKSKDEKLSDLLVRAGGLTAQAYENGATLLRKVTLSEEEINQRNKAVSEISDDAKKGRFEAEAVVKDKQEAIGIDLGRILRNPSGKEDIILQDGDIIDIPKRLETVRLQGELLFPTTVKYRSGSSFMDYVSQGGGFTRMSLKRKSYVIYPNGSIDRTRKFLFFNVYPKVEPGSEIHVPQRTQSDLAEAQRAMQSVIGISSTLMTLITTVLAFKVLGAQ
ncbi:SLBB domain-containing protein [Runella sp.]|jgi:protein involved in polysaccharide export with SLBB domain|uniref:polysaccharide biosynthesis/export family protein n=1 Tax=Runella sp. TaxID=1960881 RepID=UPI0026379FAF|nr:SLBB domain-containing protein [Runella sp.]